MSQKKNLAKSDPEDADYKNNAGFEDKNKVYMATTSSSEYKSLLFNLNLNEVTKEEILQLWEKDLLNHQLELEKSSRAKNNITEIKDMISHLHRKLNDIDLLLKHYFGPVQSVRGAQDTSDQREIRSNNNRDLVIRTSSENFENPNRVWRLDSCVPTYSGLKNENLEEWILIILKNIELLNIPLESQCLAIKNHVKGKALQVYIRYMSNEHRPNKNLKEFFEKLADNQNIEHSQPTQPQIPQRLENNTGFDSKHQQKQQFEEDFEKSAPKGKTGDFNTRNFDNVPTNKLRPEMSNLDQPTELPGNLIKNRPRNSRQSQGVDEQVGGVTVVSARTPVRPGEQGSGLTILPQSNNNNRPPQQLNKNQFQTPQQRQLPPHLSYSQRIETYSTPLQIPQPSASVRAGGPAGSLASGSNSNNGSGYKLGSGFTVKEGATDV